MDHPGAGNEAVPGQEGWCQASPVRESEPRERPEAKERTPFAIFATTTTIIATNFTATFAATFATACEAFKESELPFELPKFLLKLLLLVDEAN